MREGIENQSRSSKAERCLTGGLVDVDGDPVSLCFDANALPVAVIAIFFVLFDSDEGSVPRGLTLRDFTCGDSPCT